MPFCGAQNSTNSNPSSPIGFSKPYLRRSGVRATAVMANAIAYARRKGVVVVAADLPADAMTLLVTAKQFEWNVTYPGPDGELETGPVALDEG